MKIVFMGTPYFAVPSLEILNKSKHEIVSVVTVPDKPAGRGQKVKYSPVKEYALSHNLSVLQPEKLADAYFKEQLSAYHADVFVVVAFRILPEEIFSIPPKGTINLHSSLLPKYRGAAPINWAIINGESETGVSTIFINKEVDAGNLLLQKKISISDEDTAGDLHDKLAEVGAALLLQTVNGIEKNSLIAKNQIGDITKAPKLTRELGNIDWTKSNSEIKNLVRGLAPRPGVYSFLNKKLIKFFEVERVFENSISGKPGEVISADSKAGILIVATGNGQLEIKTLQPEGKRRMSAGDFLRGYQVKPGVRFGSE